MADSCCVQCGAAMATQRSTRHYCSNRCRQLAKRARARYERTLAAGEIPCEWCGDPMPGVRSDGRYPPRRYCKPECQKAARNVRRAIARSEAQSEAYRARVEEERRARYRVAEPALSVSPVAESDRPLTAFPDESDLASSWFELPPSAAAGSADPG